MAGDCGAGYVNPGNLLEPRKWSGLPSGLDVWTEHCKTYFKLWDISITGFIIDGYASHTGEAVEDAYTQFSLNGIGLHFWSKEWGVHKGMPYRNTKNYDLLRSAFPGKVQVDCSAPLVLPGSGMGVCNTSVYTLRL